MRPGARIAAAAEVLDDILTRHRPASTALAHWGKAHRFAGSGDRAAIGEHEGGMLALASQIALTHHEKYDGSGYPQGLRGDAIPLAGRIVAIADVFDALTSTRPYKKAWTEQEALDFLREQKGRHFDPALVDLFVEQMPAVRAVQQRWAEA